MRVRHIRLVFWRELLDYRRQRKVWRRLFLQPLLLIVVLSIPVLIFRSTEAKEHRQEFTVAVEGDVDAVPGLRAALDRRPLDLEVVDDGGHAVVSRGMDVAVVVPVTAAAEVAAGRTVRLRVLTLPAENSSRFGGEAVRQRLDGARRAAAPTALERLGLPGAVAAPFAFTTVDLSTSTGGGTRFGLAQALPPLLVIQLFGLMAAAEERLAGAKDRRVLEPLLLLPFRRLEILLGIGVATMSAGLAAASLLFVPLVLGLTLALASVTGAVAGPAEVATALLLGIAVFGVVFTSIGLYAGARAHSGGEGSVFVNVIQMAIFAMVSFTPFLSDVSPQGAVLLVPVLGPMLLVRDGVASGFEAVPTATAIAGAVALAVVLVRRSVALLESETSVLRSPR